MSVTAEPIDVLRVLLTRWKTLLIFAVLGAGVAVAYAMLTPPWYAATLSVLSSHESKNPLAAGLAATLPIDTGSPDVERISAVLTSSTVADAVIDKFQLQQRYGIASREQTRAQLRALCVTTANRKSGLVSLVCEDKDPKVAMEMATYFGEVGNQTFARISSSSAHEERRFLEEQVVKAQAEVDAASTKLREFQIKHKLVDLPEQSKAVISAMASIESELVAKQLDLSYLTSFSARTESGVQQLEQQITIMESKLKQLQDSGSGSASNVDGKFFPDAMMVPELRYELEQILREQKIKETIFFLMTQRFETAKVDEARDTSTFQILDAPTLPDIRSRPKRKKIVAMGVLASLALGACWILAPLFWRQRIG